MDINIESIHVKIEIGCLIANPACDYLYSAIFLAHRKNTKW